eukprot:4118392-Prymnesium_polylepis.2
MTKTWSWRREPSIRRAAHGTQELSWGRDGCELTRGGAARTAGFPAMASHVRCGISKSQSGSEAAKYGSRAQHEHLKEPVWERGCRQRGFSRPRSQMAAGAEGLKSGRRVLSWLLASRSNSSWWRWRSDGGSEVSRLLESISLRTPAESRQAVSVKGSGEGLEVQGWCRFEGRGGG